MEYSDITDAQLLMRAMGISESIALYKIKKSGGLFQAVKDTELGELFSRCADSAMDKGVSITDILKSKSIIKNWIGGSRNEKFCCLFLDNQHQLISKEVLWEGTINSSCVYPREVALKCLKHNAVSVIFAHNHPSGSNTASNADKQITKKLVNALALIDVKVLDHLIVGSNVLSMKESRDM